MRLPEVFMAVLLLAAAGVASADPIDLKPFRATYIAEWKGMTAAGSTVELKNVSANIYTYSSVNSARGVFRMAFPDALIADQHIQDRRRARRADAVPGLG